ncbi:MAG: hypothetical protein IJX47_04860 [Clostridia bacterium]|nr:hypothetical protein [Clostridia bacterium]
MSKKTINITFLSIFLFTLIASFIYSYIHMIRAYEKEPSGLVYLDFVIIMFIASFVLLSELFIWRSTVYLFYSRQRTTIGIIINILLMALSGFEIVYAVYSFHSFSGKPQEIVLMGIAALMVLCKLMHYGILYIYPKLRAHKQPTP